MLEAFVGDEQMEGPPAPVRKTVTMMQRVPVKEHLIMDVFGEGWHYNNHLADSNKAIIKVSSNTVIAELLADKTNVFNVTNEEIREERVRFERNKRENEANEESHRTGKRPRIEPVRDISATYFQHDKSTSCLYLRNSLLAHTPEPGAFSAVKMMDAIGAIGFELVTSSFHRDDAYGVYGVRYEKHVFRR